MTKYNLMILDYAKEIDLMIVFSLFHMLMRVCVYAASRGYYNK